MRVLLLNIDSKQPNIALHKVEMWHKQQGDAVVWDIPMMALGDNNARVDKVYASCVFEKNRAQVLNYLGLRDDVIVGGAGYDLTVKLPPEIEAMTPKINYGYTTRGCIRRCPFCIVWKAEGKIKVTGDLYDLWDGESRGVTLLDNNILAVPDHFAKICAQARIENISIDFNQGLDIRLVTPQVCELLKGIKMRGEVKFAFDDPKLEPVVREKVALLNQYQVRSRYFFYVLVGYNTTFPQDLLRCNILRELGCIPYIMRHKNTHDTEEYRQLVAWANQVKTFKAWTFREFWERHKRKRTNVDKELLKWGI